MGFRVERDEFIGCLEEVKRRIVVRERELKDLASYAVKVKDYTAEAIYALTTEVLELEKLLALYIAAQISR